MKKQVLVLFLFFLVFGMVANSLILADEGGDNNKSGSENSGSNDGNSESKTGSSESNRKNEEKTKAKNNEVKSETRKRVIDESGNVIDIRVKTEVREDKTERKEKVSFVDENGNQIEIKTEFKAKNGEEEIKRKISVNGVEAESKLEIKEDFDENETRIKVKLSNGRNASVKIMPDRASEKALEVLGKLGFNLELKEVGENNEEKEIVYSARLNETGRFLGLIKVNLISETIVSPETGEIIKKNIPWWKFLIIGKEVETEAETEIAAETNATENNSNATTANTALNGSA